MHFNEALNTISLSYIPGVRGFYEAMANDPWQASHDKLESHMLLYAGYPDYPRRLSKAVSEFSTEILELIANAKPFLTPRQLSLVDAFHVGDADRVAELDSLASNSCIACDATKNVRVVARPGIKRGIYCSVCVPFSITR